MITDNHPYLIIGGTTKAGTTSLYNYLADHPDICAASYKETRFFLDPGYPLQSKHRFNNNNLDEFENFFSQCNHKKIRMEATPDYLYSKDTANKISHSLPNAKIVFILRDPLDRLQSWYRFAQQKGFLSNKTSFNEYVNKQFEQPQNEDTPQYMRALEQGRYSTYLKSYYDLVGSESCLVISFDELAHDPLSAIRKICDFAGLNSNVYNSYQFNISNATVGTRFAWLQRLYTFMQFHLRKRTHNHPLLHKFFKKLRNVFDIFYNSLNQKGRAEINISTKTKKQIIEYYDQFSQSDILKDQHK